MNKWAFEMALENIRENRDIRLVTKEERRNCLATEPNYHTMKEFLQHLLAIKIKKNKSKNEQTNLSTSVNCKPSKQ